MILMDRQETRTMEFQKHFQSKTILIFKEEFIWLENANLGKVTKIGKKKVLFLEVSQYTQLIWNFGWFQTKEHNTYLPYKV